MPTSNWFYNFNAKISSLSENDISTFKEQPFQTLQQHDVSWEKSVQFYCILTIFIINDFELKPTDTKTMTKKSTEAKYFGKIEPVSVKFPVRTPLLVCS